MPKCSTTEVAPGVIGAMKLISVQSELPEFTCLWGQLLPVGESITSMNLTPFQPWGFSLTFC